jgi:hypothetical protein
LEERLVLVSTKENGEAQLDEGYVYVDWGAEFYAQHSVHFPDYAGAGVVANIGWLGLQHILQSRGSGPFISWRSGGAVPRRKNPAISERVSAGQIAEVCGQLPKEMMAFVLPATA